MTERQSIAPHADRKIDITADLCPMTFVRTRLALDSLQTGQILLVRLRGEEPVRNVPRSVVALGHAEMHRQIDTDGATLLWLRKA